MKLTHSRAGLSVGLQMASPKLSKKML